MSQRDKITIYDISRKLKISAATVSRALNNNERVSQKTKDLVLKTAKELNYQQNSLAVALKSGRTFNVGVVVPYINRSFFASVIRGIEEELEPKGYHVIICQTHENAEKEERQIQALLNTHIDGVFISVSKNTANLNHLKKVLQSKIPLIFFDRKKEIKGVSSVTINDFKGAYEAVSHLIESGYSQIVYIGGDRKLNIYEDRYRGYISALEDHGLSTQNIYTKETSSSIESGIDAIDQLIESRTTFDAIFCASDYIALGCVQQLRKLGMRIPHDVGVVGFSNEPFTSHLENPLTTVGQTPVLMGKIAAQVFLEQVNAGKGSAPLEQNVVLNPELFIRSTSTKKK